MVEYGGLWVEYGWWIMVDNGGIWWEYGGIWWTMVEYGGIWWNMGGIWWNMVEYGGGIWWNMVVSSLNTESAQKHSTHTIQTLLHLELRSSPACCFEKNHAIASSICLKVFSTHSLLPANFAMMADPSP